MECGLFSRCSLFPFPDIQQNHQHPGRHFQNFLQAQEFSEVVHIHEE
jgi:hypothetical protein